MQRRERGFLGVAMVSCLDGVASPRHDQCRGIAEGASPALGAVQRQSWRRRASRFQRRNWGKPAPSLTKTTKEKARTKIEPASGSTKECVSVCEAKNCFSADAAGTCTLLRGGGRTCRTVLARAKRSPLALSISLHHMRTENTTGGSAGRQPVTRAENKRHTTRWLGRNRRLQEGNKKIANSKHNIARKGLQQRLCVAYKYNTCDS